MFQKNPLFSGRANVFIHRRISNISFYRHRMSGRNPMSNRDEFPLGNEIGFAIIISCRGE